jgi:hypothetical protein
MMNSYLNQAARDWDESRNVDELCSRWADMAAEFIGSDDPPEITVSDELHMQCDDVRVQFDAAVFRQVINELVSTTETQLYNYVWITLYHNGKPEDIAKNSACNFRNKFRKMFD